VSAIAVDKLTKAWDDTTAVDGISFEAPEGQFTVLLGPSGCGKSTTLRLIAGLESVTAGRVVIGGQDVTAAPPAKRDLSMVFQSYALFPHLTVAENILFGLRVRKVARAEREERLRRTAGLLGLSELLARRPSQLSGGQQQRVALGRAIIAEKPVCLMDEPLSNLDAKLRHEMRLEIRALQRKLGISMIYVTHDQAEAMSMADRVVLLREGRIEQTAPPEEIYQRPASSFVARFIGTPPMNILRLAEKAGGAVIEGLEQPAILDGPLHGTPGSGLCLGLRPWRPAGRRARPRPDQDRAGRPGMSCLASGKHAFFRIIDRPAPRRPAARRAGRGIAGPTGVKPKEPPERPQAGR
jgi:sn-glycerol 3-phosphate transport system ATP-binding protein